MSTLHPRLANDCIELGRFTLCRLLLMKDANYPWFILVPNTEQVSEIFQLTEPDQQLLWRESSILATALSEVFRADKINIAALGNVVPQLHVHHIVRYKNDLAWPEPVWGKVDAEPYSTKQLDDILGKLRQKLSEEFIFTV
ncbi:MAG: HIT domain-containing protein [Gammaproteobacteria bacterium]